MEMISLLEALTKPNSQVLVIEHSSSTEEPQTMPEHITVGLEKSAVQGVLSWSRNTWRLRIRNPASNRRSKTPIPLPFS
jgi:hypothetical protein